MIVASALYLIGLAVTLALEPLRKYYLPVAYLWLLLCVGVIGTFIVSGADVAELTPDRVQYTIHFDEMANFKGGSVFEPSFAFFTLLVREFTANERSEAINAWINQAVKVKLTPGIYNLACTIVLGRDGATLEGSGERLTTINWTGPAGGWPFELRGNALYQKLGGVRVQGGGAWAI